MSSNSLKKAFETSTGLKLGKGFSYACLYTLKKYPGRVVKMQPLNNSNSDNKMLSILKTFNKQPHPSIVKIFDVGIFEYEDYKYYYYVMEKLNRLPASEDEEMVSTFESFYKRRRRVVPTFVSKKLQNFIKGANSIKHKYKDIHSGNIMIDKKGNYKFVDLESFNF